MIKSYNKQFKGNYSAIIHGNYDLVYKTILDYSNECDSDFPEWYEKISLPDLTWEEQIRLYAQLMEYFVGDRVVRIMDCDSPNLKNIKEYEELSTGDIIHITNKSDMNQQKEDLSKVEHCSSKKTMLKAKRKEEKLKEREEIFNKLGW